MRSDTSVKTTRFSTRALSLVAASALAFSLAACGSDDDKDSSKTITVFAASSLTGTFTELGKQFEAANPGVKVTFNFAGSSDLVTQIQNGAPADVFASADVKNMQKVTTDQLEGTLPANFATNTLEIVTPPDNPGKVDALADLGDKALKIAICQAEVPCGSAAATAAEAAGVTLAPDTEEENVKGVLGKVAAGEADAGLVYVTDVLAAGDTVKGIELPQAVADAARNTYPITTIKASKNGDLATAFMNFVLSAEGQSVLAAAGFAPA